MTGRFVVRRRVWARELRRRRRPRSEAFADGATDLVVLGPAFVAVWHGIALAFEGLVVGLATAAQLLLRVVTRQPWPVEASFRSNGAVARSWEVRGFGAAGRAAEQIQARLDAGHPLPPAGRYDPANPPSSGQASHL